MDIQTEYQPTKRTKKGKKTALGEIKIKVRSMI